MRVRLTEIRLRPTGKTVRLDRDVDVGSLFIGRGPDNDLSLSGLTISLHHATVRMSEGRAYIEAAPGQEVNVNGLVTNGDRIQPGDRIRIGPWELRVIEPVTAGGTTVPVDLALEYEEIDRAESERSALDTRTRLGLERGLLAQRPLSWAAIGVVIAGFLVLPLLWQPAQTPWNTGDVSRGHAYIEDDCRQCHAGFFEPVRNEDCMTCHHDIGRHSPPDFVMPALDDADCATCHLEHRGRDVDLADLGSGFCSDCHVDLAAQVFSTSLRNASDFGEDHPPFKLALVTDPESEPTSVDWSEGLTEASGLAFSHLRHVGKAVSGRGDRKQFLRCGACHEVDAGGRYMKPIAFEEHCQDCHRLDFDASAPPDFVPHGDPAVIRARVRGFYANRVLEGDVKDPAAPRRLRLRRPGAVFSPDDAELSRQWVETKLAAVERRFYERPGTCATCHALAPGAASDGGVGVAPVRIQTRWVPGSVFSHDSHTPFACVKCHPAAAVFDPDPDSTLERPEWSREDSIPYALVSRVPATPVSETSADVLIPRIDVCRECHAGAEARGGDQVPSPCSMCHDFHVRSHGPMGGHALDADASLPAEGATVEAETALEIDDVGEASGDEIEY